MEQKGLDQSHETVVQGKFSQPEHWIFQNLFARLTYPCTKFQVFNIQIEENFFGQMLKAWIVDYFLHF